jgi:glyoxylase-like metal-dependent hydrolase (beta-lactamase superfamily II)
LGFAGSRPYPSQCAHIALAHASILVDAGDYVQAIALELSYLPPVYLSPPGHVEQLQSQGIRPEDITHAIITHAHFDHYDDTTVERDGEYVPLFPNARVFPGRADWDYPETRETLEHSLLE